MWKGLVGEDGFEPSKLKATDLQSAPFGHSGILPYSVGAGRRTRTPDLLITNQLLYQLSYTSIQSFVQVSLSPDDYIIIAYNEAFVKAIFKIFSKIFIG